MSRAARSVIAFAATVVAGFALTGCGNLPAFGDTESASAVVSVRGSAGETLAELPVKGRAPDTGYDRDEFNHWITRDGCDTRARILERDAEPEWTELDSDGCVVGARIDGPYSGEQITEDPGPASDVDIDHVVALADAWRSGAQQLSDDEREQLANDPLNLLAVDDGLNQQKSDSNAASWLPPNKIYRCEYVARQVAVKTEYGLWVTSAERDAIDRVLGGCPNEPLPAG